jgi:hypothetical protein
MWDCCIHNYALREVTKTAFAIIAQITKIVLTANSSILERDLNQLDYVDRACIIFKILHFVSS